MIPVDSGMGVEDWESGYKVPDLCLLDDYLDSEQKMWEDEDKSIIYRICDSCESKGSRFYQTLECDRLSSDDMLETNDRTQRKRRGYGSGEVRLVYREVGSFEDEASPPEIDIIPSVKQLQQPTYTESLLYKTRLWAKTALEGTLENYAAFCDEEAAREEAEGFRRIEYNSVGSDELQYLFGTEEALEDPTFMEGDASFEYENYFYPGKCMSPFGGQDYDVDPLLSAAEEPSDEFIDPMGELQSLVHSVSQYLAVKEEEILKCEFMSKAARRKLPALPTEAKLLQQEDSKKAEVKEESSVEQGMSGVKHTMSSLFSTLTGSKCPTEVEVPSEILPPQPSHSDSAISKLFSLIPKANPDVFEASAATEPPTSQASPQPGSGISKLLAFIPKTSGTSPPVAVVPPACQEPTTEKFSLQSFLFFQSCEPSQQADANQTHVSTEAGNLSTSGFDSFLGRLRPLRLFSNTPSSAELSPQYSEQSSESAANKDSQPGSARPHRQGSQTEKSDSRSESADLMPDTGSGSTELSQETGSGSVELLPETESSGELLDVKQRGTTAASEAKPEDRSKEMGFFSPFKKSLSTLISTAPPESSSQPDTKPTEQSLLGSKIKIPFFTENASTTILQTADRGVLSGILKLGLGEDANFTSNSPSPTPAKSSYPSRATLLESMPKENTGTGWFSNLFKVAPGDPAKEPATKQMTPTVTLTKPCGQTEPEEVSHDESNSSVSSENKPYQDQTLAETNVRSEDKGPPKVMEGKAQPETLQPQGILSGLLKLGSTDLFDKKTNEEESEPHQGGLFSSFFSPSSQSSLQTQQNSATQHLGVLSGGLKLASDTVSASTNQPTSPGDQSGQTPVQGQGLLSGFLKKAEPEQNSSSAPSALSPELLSRLKFGSTEESRSDKGDLGQSPETSDQQLAAEHTPLIPTPTSQPSGLFGGLLKLTEPSPLQTSTQGGLLSGLFGLRGQDTAPTTPSQPSRSQQQGVKSDKQTNQTHSEKAHLTQQNQVSPQQSSNGLGGMLSGSFNKVTDRGMPQSAGIQPPHQHAQRPEPRTHQQPPSQQGGFLSGLFSAGSNTPAPQHPPVNHQNQQQPQQGNRQPLRRQNHIPPQPSASAAEPQIGGFLSGFFNRLASNDSVPQQPSAQTGSQQASTPVQLSSQQGGFLSGLFGPQQQQQPSKMASPQQISTQQASQTGGLLSGVHNLTSGGNVQQEQAGPSQIPQHVEPNVKSEQNQTGALFSGLLNKISATAEQYPSPVNPVTPQIAQQQQQPCAGQGRPQIQRTKPVEVQPFQEVFTDKESNGPSQRGFLSGLFSVTEEPSPKTQQPSSPAKEEPKTSTEGSSHGLSSIFKRDRNLLAHGKESSTVDNLVPHSGEDFPSSVATLRTASRSINATVDSHEIILHSQARQNPITSPTQRYLEEIQYLLYGTADEYGYKDLLYNFTEHGVIPPELYNHQCLIEALLWQQLNDYIQAEVLATQVQFGNQTYQGYVTPTVIGPQMENHISLNHKDMDISVFNVPSHPWRDDSMQLFESRNCFFDPGEDLILFDMSCRNNKSWSSCDHLNEHNRNRKPWIARGCAINLSMKKSKARLSRCHSLAECNVQEFSKMDGKGARNSYLQNEKFDLKSATEFLKRLATKKGPVDLSSAALDLSSSAGEADYDLLFVDSEWYQQWLSLLEQGLWWPAEAGDCGYYVYTDENYIYSLLTDKLGRHLYACATEEKMQTLRNITENVVDILKQRKADKITLCGFKIPLTDDSKCFWATDNQLNNFLQPDSPINLTSALKKGEKIMNMNLESFSQMFQESISSQAEQPIDFSVCELKKINVESIQNTHSPQEEPMEAADFSLRSLKGGHGGPYWKNQELKDVFTSSTYCSRQIFQCKQYPIPEIKIAHVDDTHADQSRHKASSIPSRIIGKPTTTITSKPKPLQSTSTTSSTVSCKLSDISIIMTEEAPSTSKIPENTESRRKLPTLPTVSLPRTSPAPSVHTATASSAKTTTSTLPSMSSQRPHLARQLSQADKSTVLPHANRSMVTGMCDEDSRSPAITQTCSQSQKQPQVLLKELKPQLYILNNTSVKYSGPSLYNRNQILPLCSSQKCHKVLDFSNSVGKKKKAKQIEDSETSVDDTQRREVVDCTMYKLKQFKGKKQINSEISLDFAGEAITAVDLTKETEEEEVEWPKSDCPSVSTVQDISNTKQCVVLDQHHNHHLSSSNSISEEAQTNQTNFSISDDDAEDVSAKLTSASVVFPKSCNTKTKAEPSSSRAVHASSKVSNLNKNAKQITTTELIKHKHISPQSHITRKQVDIQRQQLPKQQSSPIITTGLAWQIPSNLEMPTSTIVSCPSSKKSQQYQKICAPANSIKSLLDMSVKKTTQQMLQPNVPTNYSVCDAMSLTKRKPSACVETDQSVSYQESIDLTYKAVSQESRQDMDEYIYHPSVKELNSSVKSTEDIIFKSYTISKEMDPNVDDPSKSLFTNAQKMLNNQLNCESDYFMIKGQSWLSKPRHLVQLPSQSSVPKLTHETFTYKEHASTEVLDMSVKFGEANLEKIVPQDEWTTDQAIPLVNKPSAREVARKDSVGVALIVEQTHPESRSQIQSPNMSLVQKVQRADTVPALRYPLCSNIATLCSGVSQSIFKSTSPSTAPSNSGKYTLDMSTKTSTSEAVVQSSDPVPLVRRRLSSLAYSHEECVGVPLVVDTQYPHEHPKRQQTGVVKSQKPVQRFVQSQESSVPANSIRNSLDMSLNAKQKRSETDPIIFSSEVVPLVRHKEDVTRNCSDAVPLIVDQSACQQKRQIMAGVNTPETLHQQISTSHFKKAFSWSSTTFKDTQQHNKPMDFSAKDCLIKSRISKNLMELKDGEPMNFTNVNIRKELSKKKPTIKQLENKMSVGIVDLSVDLQNSKTTDHQAVKDLTFHASVLYQHFKDQQQQKYTPANVDLEVRNDSPPSQTQQSYRSYSSDKQATARPRRQFETQVGTGIHSERANSSLLHLVPTERRIESLQHFDPNTLQNIGSTQLSLNTAYQVISARDELNKPKQTFPNKHQLPMQHSVPQQHFHHPDVEISTSQPNPLKLHKQDTTGQHDMTQRPRVLIKQATVDSYGSTEEFEEGGLVTRSNDSAVPCSIQHLISGDQTVTTTLSLNVNLNIQQADDRQNIDSSLPSGVVQAVYSQSPVAAVHDAKGPLPLSKPDKLSQQNIPAHHYHPPTLPSSYVDSVQFASQVPAPLSQPTSMQSSSKDQGIKPEPQELITAAGFSSVKGLISLFSGLNAQSVSANSSAPVSHHAKILSKPVNHSTGEIPPEMLAIGQYTVVPVTHVVKTRESVALNTQCPIGSSSLSCITTFEQDNAESKPMTPQSKLALSSELSKAQSATIVTQLGPKLALITEPKGWILNDESYKESPADTSTNNLPLYAFKPTPFSQEYKKPQATINVCTERKIAERELIIPETSPIKLPDSKLHERSQRVDDAAQISQSLPEATSKSTLINKTTVYKPDTSQQPVSNETNVIISTQSINVKTTLDEVLSASNEPQEKSRHPRSIYIGINSPDMPFATDETDDLKPFVRLPHIFVSAASSPEKPNEVEICQCSKPAVTEVVAFEDVTPHAEMTPEQSDFLPDMVAKSDKSKGDSATENCIIKESTEISVDGVKTCSPKTPLTMADQTHANKQESQHILIEKSPATCASLSNVQVKSETYVALKPKLHLTSADTNISTSDTSPLEVIKPLSELACQDENLSLVEKTPKSIESLEESSIKDENKPSETALPQTVLSLNSLHLEESVDNVQHIQDEHEKDVSLSGPESTPINPPTEEIAIPKEDSTSVKVDPPKVEQTEQPGNVISSLFSGSTTTQQQTSSQTGLSILGGIFPGSSTIDTSGASLPSMFGGSNALSSPENQATVPQSAPQETQGKGLFSMFSGSSVQPPSGPRGLNAGCVRPRSPPFKEPPGKGLFSMFGASALQQPPSPKGHPGVGPTSKGPSTGSSLFGGILPGSETLKDTPGLFSKLGNFGAQPQTGPRVPTPTQTVKPPRPSAPEVSGKKLFSMFSGPDQGTSETQAAVSKPSDSDGGFKVSSMFSLAGGSDINKSKIGFGLFGMSFLEETKTKPEKKASFKEDVAAKQVKPTASEVFVKEVKDEYTEPVTNVSSEPPPTKSLKEELHGGQVEQLCQNIHNSAKDTTLNATEISVQQTDPQIDTNKESSNQLNLSCHQNAPTLVETSVADTSNIASSLSEKVAPEQVTETQSDIVSANKDTKDVVEVEQNIIEPQTDVEEIKSTHYESGIAVVSPPSEKDYNFQMLENVTKYKLSTNTNINADQLKPVVQDGVIISELQEQTETVLKVAVEEYTTIIDTATALKEALKVSSEEQTSATVDENSSEKTSEDDDEEQPSVATVEKSSEDGLQVSRQQTAVDDTEKISNERLKSADGKQAVVTEMETLPKEATSEDSEQTTAHLTERDLNFSSDVTVKEPTEPKPEATTEPAHELNKTHEKESVLTVASSSNEVPVSTSITPAAPPQYQQPRQSMTRPPGPPRPSMGAPRIGETQAGSPRLAVPRQPGSQKTPQPTPFSGFMSMFSSSSAPSKSSPVGGFFSSSPGTLFIPSSRQPQQQQQKNSFFGLPSSIATETITGDLFGMFKSSEATKSEEPLQFDTKPELDDLSANVTNSENTVNSTAASAPSSEDEQVKSIDDSPEKGLLEEAERKDKSEENSSLIDSTIKPANNAKIIKYSLESGTEEVLKIAPPTNPEAKGLFDIPNLTTPTSGFMSVASDGTSSVGSLFSTTSPAAKTQHQQTNRISGFKSVSAGLFQEEKMIRKEETSITPSVFGLKLSSMFGTSDSPKPDFSYCVVTYQPQPVGPKPTEDLGELDSDQPSPVSGETEGADTSDTEGPTETSKTGSCDTLAQTPQSVLPSLSSSLSESLEGHNLTISSQLDKSVEIKPDSMPSHLGTDQPKDLLTVEAAKRLVSA